MGILKEKLQIAIDSKDPSKEVWKFKRSVNKDGSIKQDTIKLGDATDDQLISFAGHCHEMLYNTNKKNPGRYVLNDIIDNQKAMCDTELFIRWVEKSSYVKNRQNPTQAPFMRTQFLQDLKAYLDSNKDKYPVDKYYDLTVDKAFVNYPSEFNKVKIGNIIDGCLDRLGAFDSRHLSLKFITKLGLWFTAEEKKELEEKDPDTGKLENRLDVVRKRLGLSDNIYLHTSPKGLSYMEFRAMVTIVRHYSLSGYSGNKKYSEMTSKQLQTLRDKVLILLQEEVTEHIRQWEDILLNIRKVAEKRGIIINEKGLIIKDTPPAGMCEEMDKQ